MELRRDETCERLAMFDGEGGLVWLSAPLRQLLGYAPDEDLSQAILADLYPESEYERILSDAYRDAIGTGPWCGPVMMRTKTGRLLETRSRIEARFTSSGDFACLTIRVEGARETAT